MPPSLDLLTLFVVFGLSHGLLTLILFAVWRESPSPGVDRLAVLDGRVRGRPLTEPLAPSIVCASAK